MSQIYGLRSTPRPSAIAAFLPLNLIVHAARFGDEAEQFIELNTARINDYLVTKEIMTYLLSNDSKWQNLTKKIKRHKNLAEG